MCSYISWWFWAYFVYLQKHFEVIFRYVVYVKPVSEVLYPWASTPQSLAMLAETYNTLSVEKEGEL